MDASGYDGAPFIPEFYDHVVPYASRQDVAFYVDAAHHSAGPVLELGCGTGRLLVPTARAGIEIVGLDASEAAVDCEPSRWTCSGERPSSGETCAISSSAARSVS